MLSKGQLYHLTVTLYTSEPERPCCFADEDTKILGLLSDLPKIHELGANPDHQTTSFFLPPFWELFFLSFMSRGFCLLFYLFTFCKFTFQSEFPV